MAKENRVNKILRRLRDGALLVVAVGLSLWGINAAVGFVVALYQDVQSYEFTITAGAAGTQRSRLAEILASYSQKAGIKLTLVPCSGSEDALNRVEAGTIDLALIQGGLVISTQQQVRQVCPLNIEPLHLLVKEPFVDQITKNLSNLRGKRISIGPKGGGTAILASEILAFTVGKLPNENWQKEFVLENHPATTLIEWSESSPSKLPDAIFVVSSVPATVVNALIAKSQFQLVPIPLTKPIAAQLLRTDLGPDVELIDKNFLYETKIPRYVYQLNPPMPTEDLETIGTRLLVVGRSKLPAGAVKRIIQTIYRTGFARTVEPHLTDELFNLPTEFPLHQGSVDYLNAGKPWITQDELSLVEPAAILISGIFFFVTLFRLHYRRHSTKSFEAYIRRVAKIEKQAISLEEKAVMDLRQLLQLRQDLTQIKNEAIVGFADGTVAGEELVVGFLIHVNDVRHYLGNLILHSRENLEERAEHEGQPGVSSEDTLRELWKNATQRSAPTDGSEELT